ncbi:MAG: hypothetical protein JWM59_3248 [Verrucomicrobiales bacterium]|nr:hypothetical protein [Verrucomicrobiales bacterium]
MKTMLLLFTAATLAALTVTAPAADRKSSRPEKEEKAKKEPVLSYFTFVLEGAKDETIADLSKTVIGGIKDLKIMSWTKGDKGYEAKVSTTAARLSRGDITKALKDSKSLKDEKDLKVADFKSVRPDKDEKKADDKKADDKKDDKKDMKPDSKSDSKDAK